MVHVNANIRNSIFKTQDNSAGRSWKWEEDGFTVYRGNARTGPGCHNNCGILMYVKDGILVKVEGDPENPYNQGRLCPRCLALNETVNHPDRLKYPLKRAGKRGENSWVRITWDEAYDFIEEKFRRIISEYGPEAITVMQGTGRDINGYGARLAYSLGSPNYANAFLSGLACYAPRLFACKMKAGHMMVADYSQFFPERYEHPEYQVPEYVLIWGNNPVVSNADGTLGHWIVELMKRGTKLITIDPKLTWLASRSEHFLQIRPGTDAALALAFSNVIIEENLYNKEFVENWTSGFADLAARCKEYPPEKAAKICGVSGRAIKEAARALGKARSASLQWGVALDHTSEGLGASMACMDLMALTGNIEKPGTMILSAPCFDVYQTWEIGWGHDLLTEEQAKKAMNEKFPLLKAIGPSSPDMLADAMLTGEPYPVKAAWIQTSNPLACMAADPHKAQQCLENMEFNVVVDLFMTPTALAVADIVLPAACFPERQGLSGHHPYYLGAIVQAINPLGECKSDQQIIYEMASRFNPEGNPWKSDIELYDTILENVGITYDELKERTWAYPEFHYNKHEKGLLRADRNPGFNTSTGKYEFKCILMESIGLDPLASFTEPLESPVSTPILVKKYPLVLTTGARRTGFFHSEHRQCPTLRRLHPDPMIQIHPDTAARYGIKQGEWVWIENDFGKCRQKAELIPTIRPDVVSADHGWWFPEKGPDDGTLFGVYDSNSSCLIPMRPGSTGLGASYKSGLCRIYKAEGSE